MGSLTIYDIMMIKMKDLADTIKRLGARKKISRGTYLFRSEDPATGFFCLTSGEVRVFKVDDQGRELEVARLGPGDFVGEAVALISGNFPFYGQAVRDSEAYYFERREIFRALAADPALGRFFIDLLARKCVALSDRIESLGLKTVRQRLIRHLLKNCPGAGRCVVDLRMKKSELARLLGTISETLSRTLRRMQADGLIVVRGPAIHIKDCPKLRDELGL